MRVGGVKLDFLRECVGIIKFTGVCLYRLISLKAVKDHKGVWEIIFILNTGSV